ncbi:UDP-2,4-diacetamido-2,4,6-trideoxy-beta-L-altropyranose hydrolase [Achromobacter sp. F4_2707]|uniref:UDP-2,4-diacetamido-2,4, 6-trideoxy-beta-L-altropyranose hydrolase n=1 Tax=Achromobacter sp. F4_2707 TaxID=3114286 RepID=UPI0039C6A9E0
MNVVFRADASIEIGTGHVMRCLTLADALAARGANCQFISRAHLGNLIEFVRSRGYTVHALSEPQASDKALLLNNETQQPTHSHWLGATQAQDAEACAPILADLQPDWLILDHYALDARWERALKPHYRRLMVIDDLADRPHECNLLLDQTYSRKAEDYRAWVPASCALLCGSQYALLRPEFAALRPYSLQRRAETQLRQLLITMGGVDKDNATGQVLEALRSCPLPADCRITVVMGATAPWLAEVERVAHDMPWSTQVEVGVKDMAQLMADSDLAIGAAGATSWERCCLGLPTIMLVLADNQRAIAQALYYSGAAQLVDGKELERQPLISPQLIESRKLSSMTTAALAVTDGLGAVRVIENLTNKAKYEN